MDFNFVPAYINTQKAMNDITQRYSFVNNEIIGFSHCKRKITALTIGNMQKRVLFCGAFHGMESLTILVLLKFFEHCCDCLENNDILYKKSARESFDSCGLTVIPCVNPDGVEIAGKGSRSALPFKFLIDSITADTTYWQANAAGVDLNHNFDAGWNELKKLEIENGIRRPSSTRFGGNRPFSEPETKALKNYCERNYFVRSFAFHSQGREIYYDFGKNTPEKSFSYAQKLAQLSGYKVSEPQGLAVGGGFKDWFIQKFIRPAFTVEIGLGKNPLPLADFLPEYEMIFNMLCYAALFES